MQAEIVNGHAQTVANGDPAVLSSDIQRERERDPLTNCEIIKSIIYTKKFGAFICILILFIIAILLLTLDSEDFDNVLSAFGL